MEKTISDLRAALLRYGLDLVCPTSLAAYNASVSLKPALQISPPPHFPDDPTLVVIGNTCNIWEPFIHSLIAPELSSAEEPQARRADVVCEGSISEHPLDEYVTRAIVNHAPSGSIVLFTHATSPPFFCARRAAIVAGLGKLHAESQLVVDSTVSDSSSSSRKPLATPALGPWLSLRAVLVLCEDSRNAPLRSVVPWTEEPDCAPGTFREIVGGWEALLRERDGAVAEGSRHRWRFSREQLEYHYSWNCSVLQNAISKALDCRRVIVDSLKKCISRIDSRERVAVLFQGDIGSAILLQAPDADGRRLTDGVADVCLSINVVIDGLSDEVQESIESSSVTRARRVVEAVPHLRHDDSHLAEDELMTSESIATIVPSLGNITEEAIRAARVTAAGLLRAKALGYSAVITGGGANELFGGSVSPTDIATTNAAERKSAIENLHYSAHYASEALGISVIQPYLEEEVRNFAAECAIEDLFCPFGRLSSEGVLVPMVGGQRILRRAFADCVSARRL